MVLTDTHSCSEWGDLSSCAPGTSTFLGACASARFWPPGTYLVEDDCFFWQPSLSSSLSPPSIPHTSLLPLPYHAHLCRGGGAAHRGHGAGRGPSCVFICSVMPTTRTRPHTHTPLSFSTLVITQDRLTTGYTCCLLQPNALYSTMDHYLSSVYYA